MNYKITTYVISLGKFQVFIVTQVLVAQIWGFFLYPF